MKKLKLHQSIKSIPIIQFQRLTESRDLRYLLFLDRSEIDNLPEVEITDNFSKAYNSLISSFPDMGKAADFQRVQFDLLKSFNLYLSEGKAKEYHKYFAKYVEFLKDNYNDFKYKGKSIDDLDSWYLELKKTEINFIRDRFYYFYYLTFEQKNKTDFDRILITCRKNGYQIDLYNDSYYYFITTIEMMQEEFKAKQNK